MNIVIVIGGEGSGKTAIINSVAGSMYNLYDLEPGTVSRVELYRNGIRSEPVPISEQDASEGGQVVTGPVEAYEIPLPLFTVESPYELEGSADAQVWARHFIVTTLGNPTIPFDEGSMTGWFANAIMRGYDTAKNKFELEFHNDCMRTAAGPEVFHYGNTAESVAAIGNSGLVQDHTLPEIQEQAQYAIDDDFIKDAVAYLEAAAKMDRWKSRLFYNKDKAIPDFDDYREGEMSLEFISNPQLIHGILGVATEGAEMVEGLLKLMRGVGALENPDEVIRNLIEESGDTDWFQELIAEALGVSNIQSREIVIEKLRKRYPDKFSEADGLARADENASNNV